MTTAIIANLEKLLGGPRDGALLRYSLGNEYLKAGNAAVAEAKGDIQAAKEMAVFARRLRRQTPANGG